MTPAAAPAAQLAEVFTRIDEFVAARAAEIHESSRHLYENPELSGEEFESAKYLAGRAEAAGFAVRQSIAGLPTAFHAVAPGGQAGPRVAFLAEYDALPTVGHGCGHNFIGTASTYAALALAQGAAGVLPGQVELFGTPSEETDGGKITMLEAGVFDGVAMALMCHPGTVTEVAYASLACISAVIEFHGRPAHAVAGPWRGVNALDAMIQLFVSLDLLKKQLPPGVKIPGVILHGGERANVVPAYTKAQFSVRGTTRDDAHAAHARLLQCAEAAALASGCRLEHRTEGNVYDDMRPDAHLAAIFREQWAAVGGEEPVTDPQPHGSLDIGNLSHRFPCLHPSIRITRESIGGHTTEFADATQSDLGRENLLRVIRALARTGAAAMADR